MENQPVKLVTLGGECIEVLYERRAVAADRDGVSYFFRVVDLVKNRGERLLSVTRFGPERGYGPDYATRIEEVCLNVIRRALDSGSVSFDSPYDEHTCQELQLDASDFKPRSPASEPEIRQFIVHKAYWLSFRYGPTGSRYVTQFNTPIDLAYLGIQSEDIKRNAWLLGEKGLLEKPWLGRASAKLVEVYEATQSTSLPNETIFPKGTQYEAFKGLAAIVRSARQEILVADNYLNDEVLDMLLAVPAQPAIRLLTFKPSPDFKVAVKRFQSQYQRTVEVRVHNAEIHDRTIVIDGTDCYALGGSIKDMGAKLTFLNRIEDPANANKLRNELQKVWAAAVPLV